MGMYTEVLIKVEVNKDLPEQVESTLNFLFNVGVIGEYTPLPEHEFFTTPRWAHVGSMSSYYHIPWSVSAYRDGYIFSRSDIKNYHSEIELFFDWIRPYCDAEVGDCIGWIWYEEDSEPTLIYME